MGPCHTGASRTSSGYYFLPDHSTSRCTKRNFYLPLAAVFAQWCKQLGSKIPFMYGCMWDKGAGNGDFFSGVSLDRYAFNPQLTGAWEQEVGKAKFSLVGDECLAPGLTFGQEPSHRPTRTWTNALRQLHWELWSLGVSLASTPRISPRSPRFVLFILIQQMAEAWVLSRQNLAISEKPPLLQSQRFDQYLHCQGKFRQVGMITGYLDAYEKGMGTMH